MKISDLNPGMYFIEVTKKGRKIGVTKFIKE